MNSPQFKIYGSERKIVKKKLSELKSFMKSFWYHHTLDKDMTSFYGSTKDYPMSDDDASILFYKTESQILELENKLKEPYKR